MSALQLVWQWTTSANLVTIALAAIVALSLLQGIWRGASGSAKQLFYFLTGALAALAAVAAAAWLASLASPIIQTYLTERGMSRPGADASVFAQFAYTILSGLRDFPLFRFSVSFFVFYAVLRTASSVLVRFVASVGSVPFAVLPSGGAVSRTVGGVIGAALGAGRALLLTALLFGYCALFPQSGWTNYIESSGLYQEAAAQIIRPAAGTLIENKLPVFAREMSGELDQLWQRRYDVIDADLPADIVSAAKAVTEGKNGDEAKAIALYDWVGSRIRYDQDKVIAYEERGEWREQNPEATFATRKGVCIDYARLYAAMARAVGLDARVVTGLGYDGRGGYGPHAWNEVYLHEREAWVPLDPTWAQTGDWFDPPKFADTHIRQA